MQLRFFAVKLLPFVLEALLLVRVCLPVFSDFFLTDSFLKRIDFSLHLSDQAISISNRLLCQRCSYYITPTQIFIVLRPVGFAIDTVLMNGNLILQPNHIALVVMLGETNRHIVELADIPFFIQQCGKRVAQRISIVAALIFAANSRFGFAGAISDLRCQ